MNGPIPPNSPFGTTGIVTPTGVRDAPSWQAGERTLHCTVMAVDVNGFGDPRRTGEDQTYLRGSLYRLLSEALESARVPWPDCIHEDRGDGVLIVASSATPTGLFLGPVFEELRLLLRRYNRWSSELVRIRLRMVLHAGYIHFDEHGMAGHALVHAFRLLEAPTFKTVFASSGADLGLTVSDYLYQELVRPGLGAIDGTSFMPLPVEVKETSARSWVRLALVMPPSGISYELPLPPIDSAGAVTPAAGVHAI